MPEITDDPLPIDDMIRHHTLATCERCGWNLANAATLLRVSLKTLYNWLNRYEVEGHIMKNMNGKGWKLKSKGAA